MPARLTTEQLKDLANARMLDVLAALGVRDREKNGYIVMCDPTRKDRHPSLAIWTRGGTLSFKNMAGDEKGDVFGLVAYFKGWFHLHNKGFQEAARFLENMLGVGTQSQAALDRDAGRARHARERSQKQATADLRKNQERAFGLWLNADGEVIDTPVDTYLQGRGIALRSLPIGPRGGERIPHVLRYLKDHPHRAKEGGSTSWPCMIAGCVEYPSGKIRAVHRTWLARDGAGKAPVDPPRKCWPEFAGLVIPLWRGASWLTPKEAEDNGVIETIVLTEGIEDGLTAIIADPKHRVWAMISLGNMANVAAVLPACCDSVIIHRQNDWHKLQAVDAFERGKAAIEATGRVVVEVAAMSGKDLNDTLRGED